SGRRDLRPRAARQAPAAARAARRSLRARPHPPTGLREGCGAHVSAVATKPRLGFLGVGWIGRNRLEAIERSGVAEIAGVSDPALDRSDDLGALELDGLVIATPSALHARQAIEALESGRAAFSQNP